MPRTSSAPTRRSATPPARHPRRLAALSEGAAYSGLGQTTLRRYIARGIITGYRVGPKLLKVDLDELDALARPIPTASGAA